VKPLGNLEDRRSLGIDRFGNGGLGFRSAGHNSVTLGTLELTAGPPWATADVMLALRSSHSSKCHQRNDLRQSLRRRVIFVQRCARKRQEGSCLKKRQVS
jgi:hypothetical protein